MNEEIDGIWKQYRCRAIVVADHWNYDEERKDQLVSPWKVQHVIREAQ